MKVNFASPGRVSNVGRIFFGLSIAVMGFQTVYGLDFPYMLIPPKHSWIPGLAVIAVICGCAIMLAGACIVVKRQTRRASLLLGFMLLMIFCFYYVPYQLLTGNFMQLVQWESAAKELALSCGAFVIAGSLQGQNESTLFKMLEKPIPLAAIVFSITIISFGIIHFQYPNEVADYIPSWVPARLFCSYFAGVALVGSGLAIIFKITPPLAALLLGIMIFTWFAILHIPRVIVSPPAYLRSEITSAFLALAYSGIALVIAGQQMYLTKQKIHEDRRRSS